MFFADTFCDSEGVRRTAADAVYCLTNVFFFIADTFAASAGAAGRDVGAMLLRVPR